MSQDNNTQPEEVKIEETVEEQTEEKAPEVEEEQTIGDIVPDDEPLHEEKKKPETVPIDVYLKLKKELKEFKKSESQTPQSVDSSIEEIANEFDVDPGFAQRLAKAIESSSISKFEERYIAEKKEMDRKRVMEESELKLDKAIESALESSPFYKDVVNTDIIKELARKTTDKSMTISKLLENVYGRTVSGKKTMEAAQSSSGERGAVKVDFSQSGDPATYAQIKADPKLWKEYNEYLVKNLNM